jgi:hypothetical protein
VYLDTREIRLTFASSCDAKALLQETHRSLEGSLDGEQVPNQIQVAHSHLDGKLEAQLHVGSFTGEDT